MQRKFVVGAMALALTASGTGAAFAASKKLTQEAEKE